MKIKDLTEHPENSNIYDGTDVDDLVNSLSRYGQLEPIVVTKSNRILSGHRRLTAMKILGWDECEVRITEPENEVVALIEHNRHRQKTKNDILREAKYLEQELRISVGRGRPSKGKKKSKPVVMVEELASKLGVGTTQLKQLQSIQNYEPKLIEKIDAKKISVSAAYKQVQQKHIHPKQREKSPEDFFAFNLKKLIKQHSPELSEIQETLKSIYPYSLEMTGMQLSMRQQVIKELDAYKKMDSREKMLVEKSEELYELDTSKRILKQAEGTLPTREETSKFFYQPSNLKDLKIISTDDGYICPKRKLKFDRPLWSLFRTTITSQKFSEGPGRRMTFFVGYENAKGFRLLGILSFQSDSQQLLVRDEHIGWNTEQRSEMREHIINMNVCVSTQPFGHNRLGGKFLSMVADRVIPIWEKKYKTKIVGITTTSLHGSKSQYSSMRWWKNLGTSSGSMLIEPQRDTYRILLDWFREEHRNQYEIDKVRSSPKQTILKSIYTLMGIDHKSYVTNHRRGVFFRHLYENTNEFLQKKATEKELIPNEDDWIGWWFQQSAKRFEKLLKEKSVTDDVFFATDIDMDELQMWLETRGST